MSFWQESVTWSGLAWFMVAFVVCKPLMRLLTTGLEHASEGLGRLTKWAEAKAGQEEQ